MTKEQLLAIPRKGIGYGLLRYLRPDSNLAGRDPGIGFNYLGQVGGRTADVPDGLWRPVTDPWATAVGSAPAAPTASSVSSAVAPVVRVWSRPKGLPMAMTQSPTRGSAVSSKLTYLKSLPSTLITAR